MPTDHDRSSPAPVVATVTGGGLVLAVMTAPALRPRLKLLARAAGRDHTGMGRAIDLGPEAGSRRWLVVGGIVVPDGPLERLAIGRAAHRAEPVEHRPLPQLVADVLAAQAEGVRHEIVAAALAATHDLPASAPLTADLRLLREALREHRVVVPLDPDQTPGLAVEVLCRLDERSVYVRGWIGHLDDELAAVTVVSPEGERVAVGATLHRFERADVRDFYRRPAGSDAGFGFACTVVLEHRSSADDGWLVEVETRGGLIIEAHAAVTAADPLTVREVVMADLVLEALPHTGFRATHVWPAVARLQERLLGGAGIASVDQHGVAPRAPTVSIVVPLYQRIDFVEHQLAAFVHDPDLREADLIYVLDSPEIADGFRAQCRRLHRLYRVPFRAVVLQRNLGFSGANNAGAALATAPLLLLLNSDVLPDRPGWLSALADRAGATGAGAVSPKLVYEDGSIQHAGLWFDRVEGTSLWTNEHYWKGLHRSFPPACVPRSVPAVTAACLLLPTELYRRLGGLRGQYVQGNFEDSDLCLRVRETGLDVWYAADVELYHLEGQSYPTPQRVRNGEFNRWLHTHLWDGAISELMQDARYHPAHRPTPVSPRPSERNAHGDAPGPDRHPTQLTLLEVR